MMFPKSTLALLGLAALSSGHMLMNTPVPYGKSTLNNSPLSADGSDFPCKQRTGVYDAEGASNTMPLGSTQKLAFTGSATHGGGSCQVSITYDADPTTDSVFKVIHSIEGGCPMKGVTGNNGDSADSASPDTYSFTIPTTLPTGSATLAWTWFNKVGNREMYMNCAPISITSGTTKRSAGVVRRDKAAYLALPDMFVANIGNGCGTQDSTDVLFPDPGDSVEQDGQATSSALATPTGSSCGKAVAATVSATAGASEAPATTAPSTTAAVSPAVFATVAPDSSAQPTVAVASPIVASTAASSAAAPASTGSNTTTSSAGALTGACTSEGMFNCISGTNFQRCASGTWSAAQSVAAGTTCSGGQTMDMKIAAVAARGTKAKRAIRFTG